MSVIVWTLVTATACIVPLTTSPRSGPDVWDQDAAGGEQVAFWRGDGPDHVAAHRPMAGPEAGAQREVVDQLAAEIVTD